MSDISGTKSEGSTYLQRLRNTHVLFVIDEIFDELSDKDTAAQIEKYSLSEGPESPVVQSLKGIKSASDAGLWQAVELLLAEVKESKLLIQPLSKDDIIRAAAKFKLSPRDTANWRNEEMKRALNEGPKTKAELMARLYVGEEQIDKQLNALVADKVVIKTGDLYELAESAVQTA